MICLFQLIFFFWFLKRVCSSCCVGLNIKRQFKWNHELHLNFRFCSSLQPMPSSPVPSFLFINHEIHLRNIFTTGILLFEQRTCKVSLGLVIVHVGSMVRRPRMLI